MNAHVRKRKRRQKFDPQLSMTEVMETIQRIGAIMHVLRGAEVKTLIFICGCTVIQGRQCIRLSYPDMRNGFDDHRGAHGGTHLAEASLMAAVKSLTDYGVIIKHPANGAFPNGYEIDHAGLKRFAAKHTPAA
ncbi:hypothetical protein [Tateyamaria sp. SN6-1]|uniref:hypothetical protein n=1 Tax=Tateyamaria sp. SN6-1 TaxID=3092148 RepID=UPI0039F44F26